MSDSQRTRRIYRAEQINIPPTFPHILKLYAKAAIRTQPRDLLRWTAAYFRALANGETPPAKDRLEYPPFMHPTGITPGYLRTLLNRFGHANEVCLRALLQDWRGLDLPETSLYQLFTVADLLPDKEHCDFYRFLAVACGFLGNSLLETMIHVCELLTREPEGGSAMIPLRIFLDLYGYLADLDCGGDDDGERHRRKAERTDSPRDPTTSVSEPSPGTIDSTPTRARSCEFAATEKSAVEAAFEHPVVPSVVDPNDDTGESLPKRNDVRETTDDAFEFNLENEGGVGTGEAEGTDRETTTAWIDLENSSETICRCLDESVSDRSEASLEDPLKEFLKRMQAEVEAGRLETVFRVPGIGPAVSPGRVTAVGLWLADCARRQEGLVGPRNIRHFLCPNLDDTLECDCT